jgi:hypothetical protein
MDRDLLLKFLCCRYYFFILLFSSFYCYHKLTISLGKDNDSPITKINNNNNDFNTKPKVIIYYFSHWMVVFLL